MAFCLTLVFAAVAFTQNNDYKRNEFYAGFSNQQLFDNIKRESLNGFEVAYVRNVHRYLGIKGDFSAAYRKKNQPNFEPIATETGVIIPSYGLGSVVKGDFNRSLYNLVGGVQIKDNASQARVKPFAHALIGVAVESSSIKNVTCIANCALFVAPLNFESTMTNLSRVYGGGLDVKVSDKFDLRAIQVDYNPIYNQSHSKNLRLGVGFVF